VLVETTTPGLLFLLQFLDFVFIVVNIWTYLHFIALPVLLVIHLWT